MKTNDLKSRLKRAKNEVESAVSELRKYEELLAADGTSVEKISQDELIKLIDQKTVKMGRQLSDTALHILAAGRCAGSYGCGIYTSESEMPK